MALLLKSAKVIAGGLYDADWSIWRIVGVISRVVSRIIKTGCKKEKG